MTDFKVGDVVRLTGSGWQDSFYPAEEGHTITSMYSAGEDNDYDIDANALLYTLEPNPAGSYSRAPVYFDDDEWAVELVIPGDSSDFDTRVDAVLRTIGDLLKAKNKAYGNSALDPVRTFSKADAAAGIRLRIDDKLSRLQRGTDFEDEDTVLDLMGYLVLLRIAETKNG